jgi:chromosome segregation ATPase
MRELYEEYKRSLALLRKRHEQLSSEIKLYDKRVALLEEEMDELCEVMSMMRPYLEH